LVEDYVTQLADWAMKLQSAVTKAAQDMQDQLRQTYSVTAAADHDFIQTFDLQLVKRLKKLNDDQTLLRRRLTKLAMKKQVDVDEADPEPGGDPG
jgi:hypothetical protein